MNPEMEENYPNDDYSRIAGEDYREDKPCHKGKGPKGYKRTDRRIWEDVCEALLRSPYVDASDIVVIVEGGNVVLKGEVSTKNEKLAAEEVIENFLYVEHITNELKIRHKTRGVLDRVSGNPDNLNLTKH